MLHLKKSVGKGCKKESGHKSQNNSLLTHRKQPKEKNATTTTTPLGLFDFSKEDFVFYTIFAATITAPVSPIESPRGDAASRGFVSPCW